MIEKDEVLRFRVTAQQKQRIEAAAARDGLTASEWLRALALLAAGALPQQTPPRKRGK